MENINGECPYCHNNTSFTSDYSLVKFGFKALGGFLFKSKTEIAKDIIGSITAERAKNYECLSCGEIVQQCPSCKSIIKYFNTGNCTNCNLRIG